MSERNSRYWIEVRMAVAARRVIRNPADGEARIALDEALRELEDYHYDRLMNDADEGMCGRCSIVGEHADEDCPEAPDEDSTDGEDDDEPEDDSFERGVMEATKVPDDLANRAIDLGRFSGRCIGILDTDPRHAGIALRAAQIEKEQGWVVHDEAGIATLLRQALKDTLGIVR